MRNDVPTRTRRQSDMRGDLDKLSLPGRKNSTLAAKTPRPAIAAATGVGRPSSDSAGQSAAPSLAGTYITTDGIFTLVIE